MIQESVAERKLNVTLQDTLNAFPGSTHWHLKRGRQVGILEVTFWSEQRRIWFSVHKNRTAPWIEEEVDAYELLRRRLASA